MKIESVVFGRKEEHLLTLFDCVYLDCSSKNNKFVMEKEEGGATLENESVHKVYDAIAPHFSNTRYKVFNAL